MLGKVIVAVITTLFEAAKETPRLFFAPLVGAISGAYNETVRAYRRS
jgi:hypothetical protein